MSFFRYVRSFYRFLQTLRFLGFFFMSKKDTLKNSCSARWGIQERELVGGGGGPQVPVWRSKFPSLRGATSVKSCFCSQPINTSIPDPHVSFGIKLTLLSSRVRLSSCILTTLDSKPHTMTIRLLKPLLTVALSLFNYLSIILGANKSEFN